MLAYLCSLFRKAKLDQFLQIILALQILLEGKLVPLSDAFQSLRFCLIRSALILSLCGPQRLY